MGGHVRVGLARLAAVVGLAVALSACAAPERGRDGSARAIAWVQFGDGAQAGRNAGRLIARVLLGPAGACPNISVDGAGPRPMALRHPADPRAALFGRLCEERLPLTDRRRIEIAYGSEVLLRQEITRAPENMVVLGDTGCRVVQYRAQDCADRAQWPFAAIADAAASDTPLSGKKPGLVIHAGDYLYREAPCFRETPPEQCRPGPFGDNAAAWRADFFEPARRLLAAAPWVFVRGNHENCNRAGYGWFYYFGDGNGMACELVHRTAYVYLDGLTLIVVDTAHADDPYAAEATAAAWRDTARTVGSRLGGSGPVFLLTHIPPYLVCAEPSVSGAAATSTCSAGSVKDVEGIRRIVQAVRRAGEGRFLAISGHVHAFEVFDLPRGGEPSRPGLTATQLVIGNGGTLLDRFPAVRDRRPLDVAQYDGREGKTLLYRGKVQIWPEFGFAVLSYRRAAGTVGLSMFDAGARKVFGCDLTGPAPPPAGRCT